MVMTYLGLNNNLPDLEYNHELRLLYFLRDWEYSYWIWNWTFYIDCWD